MNFNRYIIFLSFLLIFSIQVSSQTPCNDFTGKVVLSKKSDSIDYDYIPRSIFLPTSRPLKIPKADSLNIKLFDTEANLVYSKKIDLVEAGDYVLTFANSNCEGVYFLAIKVGHLKFPKKIILLKQQEISKTDSSIFIDTTSTKIDGSWEKHYSEAYKAQIKFESAKKTRDVNHTIELNLKKGSFEVFWNTQIGDKIEMKKFIGKYEVIQDTVRFYKSSMTSGALQMWREFIYTISNNTLTLSYISRPVNSEVMSMTIEINPYGPTLKLEGKYLRTEN